MKGTGHKCHLRGVVPTPPPLWHQQGFELCTCLPRPLSLVQGTDYKFAMKTLDKYEMQERNKVARVLTECGILGAVDHPFLATLYCTIQTDTHLHFVMEYCDGKGGRRWGTKC